MAAPIVALALKSKTIRRVLIGALALLVAGGLAFSSFVIMGVGAAAQAVSVSGEDFGIGNGTIKVPPTGAPGTWVSPVPAGIAMTSDFGPRDVSGCSYCSKVHEGIDLSGGCGSPIYAMGSGTVIVAGSHYGYGNAVIIDHGDGVTTLYGHMPWGGRLVEQGDKVTPGHQIGVEGNSGNSFGCHLHLEVSVSGVKTDPAAFFSPYGLTWPHG